MTTDFFALVQYEMVTVVLNKVQADSVAEYTVPFVVEAQATCMKWSGNEIRVCRL
jgi:hypothetical protein